MPDSLTAKHSHEVRFTFPVTLAEKICDACCRRAGGMTAVREVDGLCSDGNGNRIKDDMRLGIVTVRDNKEINYLRNRIGRILADHGEDSMWFVHHEIKGGIFDLRNERADLPVLSDLPEMKRPISIRRKKGTPLVVYRLR